MLIGHTDAVAAVTAAVASGRPHHGWLLAGPPGIGKASFAEAAAIWLLAGAPPPGFEAAHESQAAHLVAAASHPDFRRLTRTEDDKGKLRSVIRVDEVRALQGVLQQTPAIAPWRVIIVDSADELNPNAANALLKNLEEPPQKTIFFLISHAPGRLLPTIRSRCRLLRFQPLSDADVARVLAREAPDLPASDRDALIRLSAGAPGTALAMAEPGIADLETALAALPGLPPAEAEAAALGLARSLAAKTAGGRYQALLARTPAILAAAARHHSGPRLAQTLDDWQDATSLAASAGPLSLDPQTVAFALTRKIARLARA
ncbi:MAG: DNA polymerase III subunit delta' [Polymorphobacter sp.]|uniref:DNA polymerase III subunit delta' n=1 Tax=Polymorphobacter sp. TaxID=1909290 RepID=UPI003A83EEB2